MKQAYALFGWCNLYRGRGRKSIGQGRQGLAHARSSAEDSFLFGRKDRFMIGYSHEQI